MPTIIRASHPISFQLLNRDRHPVIGIFDGHQGQMSNLEITNSSRRDLRPKTLSGEPSDKNHHFELRFRPGTLSVNGTQVAVEAGASGWKISRPIENDGAVSLYLLCTTSATLKAGDTTAVTLQHLSADGSGGARGTRVELKWDTGALEYVGGDPAQSPEPLVGGHRVQHLSIVNERGQKHIPLHVGIVGGNKVLNDGSKNTLKMRITNLLKQGEGNIQLNPKKDPPDPEQPESMFRFSFDASDTEEWTLGSKSQVHNIVITAVARNIAFEKRKDTLGERTVWTLWPTEAVILEPDQFIDVTIDNVITSHPSGQANIYVNYKNIPGYWDGDFVCDIEKGPVVYRGQRVGVGATNPKAKLHVNGNLRVETDVDANGNVTIGKADPKARLSVRGGPRIFTPTGSPVSSGGDVHTWAVGVTPFNPPLRVDDVLTIGDQSRKVTRIHNPNHVEVDRAWPRATNGTMSVLRESEAGELVDIQDKAGKTQVHVASNGNVGIGNANPIGPLSVGDSSVDNSDGYIVIAKKAGNTNRHVRLGLDGNLNFVIGDFGGQNIATTWTSPFSLSYAAPNNSLYVHSSGKVGIGTNEPSKTLTVKGGLRVNDEVSIGGMSQFDVDAHMVPGGRFRVTPEGRVGIGLQHPGTHINSNGSFFRADSAGRILQVHSETHESVLILSSNQNQNNAHLGGVYFTRTGAQGDAHREVAGIQCRQNHDGDLAGGILNFFTKPSGNGAGADNPRMVIRENGRVGIGTTDPQVPLEIQSYENHNPGNIAGIAGAVLAMTVLSKISVKAHGAVTSGVTFFTYSDARIKTDLRSSNPVADLDILSRLQVTDFKYIDVGTCGTRQKKGLIAQQVEEVFPQAVSQLTGVVPDIYRNAPHADGWIETSNDLKQGDRVRLITQQGDAVYEVLEALPDRFRTELKSGSDQVFVFGREVKDLRILDHDAIAILNVSATQQLKKEMDQQVAALSVENAELRAANDTLNRRLQLLESKLEAIAGVMGAANGSNGNGRH
jgi:hypothetical protein